MPAEVGHHDDFVGINHAGADGIFSTAFTDRNATYLAGNPLPVLVYDIDRSTRGAENILGQLHERGKFRRRIAIDRNQPPDGKQTISFIGRKLGCKCHTHLLVVLITAAACK
ncbi:hypothetical protein D3C87_1582560 [compost metagenome]